MFLVLRKLSNYTVLSFLLMGLSHMGKAHSLQDVDLPNYTHLKHVDRYKSKKIASNLRKKVSPHLNAVRTKLKRKTSPSLTGYGFGPYFSKQLNTDSILYAFSFTHHREVAENAEVRLRAGLSVGEDIKSILSSGTIGGAYLPMVDDFSPIIGGEFGFGLSSGKDVGSAIGFSGAILAGVRLFRYTDTNIEVNLRYERIFKENKSGFPSVYGLQVSMLIP